MEDRRNPSRRYTDRIASSFVDSDYDGSGTDGGASAGPRTVYAVWKIAPRRYKFGSVADLESNPEQCPSGTFEILIGLDAFMGWARKFYRFEVKTLSEAEIARIAERFTKWDI